MYRKLIIFLFILLFCGQVYAADTTFTNGSGISSSDVGGAFTVSCVDATDSTKGCGSFDATDFSVSSGAVSLGANPTITGALTATGLVATTSIQTPLIYNNSGSTYIPDLNGTIVIDGTIYPRTSDGITAAVATVSTNGAATIVLTPGTYDMTSTVTITNKLISFVTGGGSSVGATSGSVILKKNASWTTGAIFNYSQTISYIASGIEIAGIEFHGNDETGDAINFDGLVNSTLRNLYFHGFTDAAGKALSFTSTTLDYPVVNDSIRDCMFTDNSNNITVTTSGTGYATANVVDHVWMNEAPDNSNVHIQLTGSGGLIELSVINSYMEQLSGKTGQVGIDANGNARIMSMRSTYSFPDGSEVDISGLTASGQSRSNFLNCDVPDPITYATRFVDNADATLKATIMDNNGSFLARSDIYMPTGKNLYLYSGATAYAAFAFNTASNQWVTAGNGLLTQPTNNSSESLIVQGAAGQSVDTFSVETNTSQPLLTVQSTGVTTFVNFIAPTATIGTTTGALTGNASTATALAANPDDCAAGTVATAIAASGALTCSITPLVSGGTLTSANVCQYDGSGIDCNLTKDGTGDCGSGAVCLGDHTHATLYGPIASDYLVGTADGTLSGEIAVGTTPGGELGNTWASPTVDDTGITLTSITIGSLLGVDSIDATGAVDMDYGSADITDHTFVADGGTVILDGGVSATGLIVTTSIQDSALANCDTIDTDGSGIFKCGTDTGAGGGISNVVEDASPQLGGDLDTQSYSIISPKMTIASTGVVVYTNLSAPSITNHIWDKSIFVENPVAGDTFTLFKAPRALTLTNIKTIVDPDGSGDSVSVDVRECDATADNCTTVDGTILADNDGQDDDGSLANPSIDTNDWVNINLLSNVGSATQLTVTVYYTDNDI